MKTEQSISQSFLSSESNDTNKQLEMSGYIDLVQFEREPAQRGSEIDTMQLKAVAVNISNAMVIDQILHPNICAHRNESLDHDIIGTTGLAKVNLPNIDYGLVQLVLEVKPAKTRYKEFVIDTNCEHDLELTARSWSDIKDAIFGEGFPLDMLFGPARVI